MIRADCWSYPRPNHANSEWIYRGAGKVAVKNNTVTMADLKLDLPMLSHSSTAIIDVAFPNLTLVMSEGSDRSWVYNVKQDLTDNTPKLIAIRFANAADAITFKQCVEKSNSVSTNTDSQPSECISAPPETPLKTTMEIPSAKEPELEAIRDELETPSKETQESKSAPAEESKAQPVIESGVDAMADTKQLDEIKHESTKETPKEITADAQEQVESSKPVEEPAESALKELVISESKREAHPTSEPIVESKPAEAATANPEEVEHKQINEAPAKVQSQTNIAPEHPTDTLVKFDPEIKQDQSVVDSSHATMEPTPAKPQETHIDVTVKVRLFLTKTDELPPLPLNEVTA
ncbi:hypothetical protein HDV01_000742 [Terramyces sp. JEL0728]|nr:hypothetical protein HDV01_000742 [Terramyces sp. JEL0728]